MASTKSSTKTPAPKRVTKISGAVAAKPAVAKKPAAKAPVKATVAVATKPARSRAKKPAQIPPEQRRNYIEMAAYYIAERRGFAPGNLLDDWVQAEAEIDRLLAEGRLGN